ncbi:protamine-2 isoform X4 [Odocoileus virginianus]|uniref:Protamine-2 n=1 Tax=Odocoileus virginianus TaxID=9874 RepID=A0A6J0WGY8_ODOVR
MDSEAWPWLLICRHHEQASCCLSPSCPPVTPFSTMVRCRVKSPTESPTGQQGSGQQGETERPEETQELRPEDIPVYGRTQRGRYHYRHRSHTRRRPCRRRRRRACRHRRRRRGSAGPPCAPIPGTPQASRPGLRLPKDEEKEEEMRKAALSFPGPTRKSHLPGSTSQDHSKSPLEPTRS